MNCPKCSGNNLQVTNEIQTQGKDYSTSKGCLGYLLFGPLGFLCGKCGQKKSVKSSVVWKCMDCGATFKDCETLREEIKSTNTNFYAMMFLAAVCVIGGIIGAIACFADGETMIGLLIALCLGGGFGGVCAFTGFFCKKKVKMIKAELKQNFNVEE